MKIVSLILVLGLIGCNSTYPSKKQAFMACREWLDMGRELTYIAEEFPDEIEYTKEYKAWLKKKEAGKPNHMNQREKYQWSFEEKYILKEEVEKNRWNRSCFDEPETKQYLGEEWNSTGGDWNVKDKREVKKNFRY